MAIVNVKSRIGDFYKEISSSTGEHSISAELIKCSSWQLYLKIAYAFNIMDEK